MTTFKKITPQIWREQRRRVVELAKEGLVRRNLQFTPQTDPGDIAIGLQNHLATASQGPGSTIFQQALLYFVCEGRHNHKGYSCCADVAHAILTLMGCWDRRIVNRDDDNADGIISPEEQSSAWRVGKNIELLCEGAKQLQVWESGTSKQEPQPGDIMVIQVLADGKKQHVLNVNDIAPSERGLLMTSVDGGQVDAGGQCVKVVQRILKRKGRYWSTFNAKTLKPGRGVLGWIRIRDMQPYFVHPAWSAK